MDIREELDLILKRIESEGVPLEQLFHDILRENFDPPPPLPSVSPPPPPPPPADSHTGGSVSYTPLGSAPPLPEHQLYGYMAAPITMQPYYVYGQPGTTSQGQLPVYNIASATTATVLPAPPPHSCAPKKQQNKQREDQAYIKKPPNAFMLYLKEQRPKVKEELSLSDSAAVNVAVGERWRSLSKEEQKKYFDEAEIQKCCHAKEHPNWSTKENYGKKRKRVRERTCTKEDAQQAKIRCVRPGQAEPSSAAIEGPHQLDRVWVCQPQTQPGVNTLTIQGTVLVQMPDTLNPVSVPVCNVPQLY